MNYPAVMSTLIVYGFVLWSFGSLWAQAIDGGRGPAFDQANRLFFWSAFTYAWSACVVAWARTWLARARMPQFVSREFARVLPILVFPEVVGIYALLLVFFTLDRIGAAVELSLPLGPAAVDSMVSALEIFALSTLAVPVAAAASNRVRDLSGKGYLRALVTAEAGALISLLGFAWAFLRIEAL